MLICIWGGQRYAWDSAPILGLTAAAILLAGGLVLRERRAADPIVPLGLLRTPVVVLASWDCSWPLRRCLRSPCSFPLPADHHRREPHRSRSAARAGDARDHDLHTLTGRSIARTGRYKRFPIAGLGLMSAALALLAALAGDPFRSPRGWGSCCSVSASGWSRRFSSWPFRTASTGASSASPPPPRLLPCPRRSRRCRGAGRGVRRPCGTARADIVDGVQAVFLVAAPLAALPSPWCFCCQKRRCTGGGGR